MWVDAVRFSTEAGSVSVTSAACNIKSAARTLRLHAPSVRQIQ